ncbi:putative transmembrane protein [Tieghemostelium lacteum]|uniref:Putative transmembrane protein n=1 Tax=Tieghemostelium lacteum TaxID=361077 RepID=A0A151ZB54_TIELA|nr:putative transmembrane protein [Tieghemostelium lacteum]|eukprot:KYQ91166.1 putative transmembrane protein [Tieghemostelium lacteum]
MKLLLTIALTIVIFQICIFKSIEAKKEDVLPIILQLCYVNIHLNGSCLDQGQKYELKCDYFGYCSDGYCVKALKLGEKCDYKLTKCELGSYCSNVTNICTPYRSVLLDASCKVDNDCIGNNTICSNSVCKTDVEGCVEHIDCKFNYYCKKDINSTYGNCTEKHDSGKCISSSECIYPKICGISDKNQTECVVRNTKELHQSCFETDNYECVEGLYCNKQKHMCLKVYRNKNKNCTNSCDCDLDQQCGYDLDTHKLICQNFTDRYQSKNCNLYQSNLLECLENNKCPYSNTAEVTVNDCLFEHCNSEYIYYTYSCVTYQQQSTKSIIEATGGKSSSSVLSINFILIFTSLLLLILTP